MKSMVSRWALGGLAAACGLLPVSSGCVSVPDGAGTPVLASHVADWRDEVIYQVIVDRFANGDTNNDYNVRPGALGRFQGGDWLGLENHLDYLQALGVTTLWISPIVRNVETDADVDSYHGYWAQNLSELNPHFGDLAALRSLTRALHARGMKVVLDIVTNHMGQVFFYDMNLNGKADIQIGGTGQPNAGQSGGATSPVVRQTEYDPDFDPRGVQASSAAGISKRAPIIFINDPTINRVPPPGILGRADAYHGLGRILDYSILEQTQLGDFPGGLKDVATENPAVRATMIDSFAHWVEQVDFDGFRIDTVKHVEHEFWQVFTKGVRDRLAPQGKSNFLMFGEAFDGNDQLLGSYTAKGQLDSVFYFSQKFQAFRDIFAYAHTTNQQKGTAQIEQLWNAQTTNYGTVPQDNGIGIPPYKALVNFMDNHDVGRFLYDAAGDVAALRNAMTFLLTEGGIPCLYYGTEQDFAGGNDPANREVLWDSKYDTTNDTFTHFAKVARLRRAYLALRRGDTKVRFSTQDVGSEDDAGILAFERAGGDAADRYALVVINSNARKASTTASAGGAMTVGAKAGTTLVDVMDPQQRKYQVDPDGTLRVTVPAQEALVLIPAEQLLAL